MWIRTAIVEKTLQPIIGELRNAPGYVVGMVVWVWFMLCRRLYYVEKSVMCHSVYGELFYYLIG